MATAQSNPFRVQILSVDLPAWVPASGAVAAVGGNLMSDLNPDPGGLQVYSQHGKQHEILNAWGGAIYARDYSTLGAMHVAGGGDRDYWGTEHYTFDFDTLLWTRDNESTTAFTAPYGYNSDPTFDQLHGEHADGTPAIPHIYDTVQYVPAGVSGTAKGLWVNVFRMGYYLQGTSGQSSSFDLDKKTYARYSVNMASGNNGATVASCYDTARQRIWWVGGNLRDKLKYLDCATRMHTEIRIPDFAGSQDHCGTCMPAQDLFVTLGVVPTRKTMQLQAFDLSNPASGMRVLALTGVPLPLAVPGLDYCPDNGALYAYLSVWGATLNTLYKITPPASNPLTNPWTVTTQTLGGVAIPNPTYADGYNGVYSKFRYVRRLRSFAFLNRTSDPVYIMRPTDL